MFTNNQILDALKDCCFDELNNENCEELICEYTRNSVFPYEAGRGATKIVLYPFDSNFVVKIPFSHDCDEVEFLDEEGNLYYKVPVFCGADEPNGWDYCKAETLYYQKAETFGVEFAFLKTELIGYVNDHPIYKQGKAEMLETREETHKKDWREVQRASNHCRSHHLQCFNEYWITDFLEYYDEVTFNLLSEFLQRNGIHDLHEGNLGYVDGVPVIVDYGGYYE
jgi:hypothetical protein